MGGQTVCSTRLRSFACFTSIWGSLRGLRIFETTAPGQPFQFLYITRLNFRGAIIKRGSVRYLQVRNILTGSVPLSLVVFVALPSLSLDWPMMGATKPPANS